MGQAQGKDNEKNVGLMQRFHEKRQEEMLEVAGFKPGDMAIVDRSESLAEKDWNLVKIVESTANEGEFLCRFYNSYSRNKNIAKREYFPCWLKKNGDEVFQENRGHVSWTAFTESFHISSLLFHPFALTKRHRIPSDIVEKLMLDQCAIPIFFFMRSIYHTSPGAAPRPL